MSLLDGGLNFVGVIAYMPLSYFQVKSTKHMYEGETWPNTRVLTVGCKMRHGKNFRAGN